MPRITRGSFTIDIPDQITTSTHIGERGLLKEERRLIDSIENRLSSLRRTLDDAYPSDIHPYDINDSVVNRLAFIEAYVSINRNLFDWVVNHCLMALIEIPEFNYDLYIEQFINAIQAHISEIVQFYADPKSQEIDIIVDFRPLGRIEEWGAAIKAVREGLNIKNFDVNLRSQFWREKIYGTAREGVTITKEYKGRGKEKKGAGTKDITDRYSGKYRDTIYKRLSFIPWDKAPFWELIDKGNISTGADIGGSPYPSFPGTHFTRTLSEFLRNQFYAAWIQAEEIARKWLQDRWNEWEGGTTVVETFNYDLDDDGSTDVELKRYDDGRYSVQEEGKDEIFFRGTTKVVGESELRHIPEIDRALWVEQRVSSRGKFFEQFRDPITGQIVSRTW